MEKLRLELAETINNLSPEDGLHRTSILGTHCVKWSSDFPREKRLWQARFGIVAQGRKEIILGGETYYCDNADYTASPIDLPVVSSISATRQKPFLALLIDFDAIVLTEIAAQIEKDYPNETENPLRALFIGKANQPMMEAAVRLSRLFLNPDDANVIGPLVIKEILYHLLKGPDGAAIRQFVRLGSKMHKISQAIYSLKSEFKDDVNVEALAKAANMSRSAFFKHFKEATSMSPIQYQKRLRLLEAKRLMIDEAKTAESSAFKVGYNSASQFSREYSRMFGKSPWRDAVKNQKFVEAF